MKDQLFIFDTTLRDGEQSPGASMTAAEKIRIARVLEKLKVDIIEAGFPAASEGDFEAVKMVAAEIKESRICGLARANPGDVARAGEAVKGANAPRIHTFIATSPIHMKAKLRMEPDDVLEKAVEAVRQARNIVDDVEFSAEDAGRSDEDFLCRVFEAVIKAGARTVNVPDTVGYTMPNQFGALFERLIQRIPNSDQAIFSVHCHNDLGVAVANSLAAVQGGARQVECTINGLGERAGNASLEEIVMAVRTRQDVFSCDTKIDTTHILPASRLVSSITGFPVQPNKAIVGANAFAHEAGIHQDGVLKQRDTYEIMRAEDVGWSANQIVLGKHSGRNAFRERMLALGIEFDSEAELNAAFGRFKELADKKHEIFDDDLQVLAGETSADSETEALRFISLKTVSETGAVPLADLVLEVAGKSQSCQSSGDGLVDAAFKAVDKLVPGSRSLLLYSVNAITAGSDSQGEVSVRLEENNRIVNGQGADTDIVVASVKAYVNGLNKLHSGAYRVNPQSGAAV
ncbi:MAG: 2-isopropylmalate synthase [Gammaproteobacteria bacterium]|nr:2-isopropylmalate synthase [Gammaproteobacteria bacterium]